MAKGRGGPAELDGPHSQKRFDRDVERGGWYYRWADMADGPMREDEGGECAGHWMTWQFALWGAQ
jgi:hypothetical protein